MTYRHPRRASTKQVAATASTRAAHPQCLIPVDEVVDLPTLHQRGLFHQADQGIGMGLRLGGYGRSLAGRKPVGQGDQLHAVSDDFAVYVVGVEHGRSLHQVGARV